MSFFLEAIKPTEEKYKYVEYNNVTWGMALTILHDIAAKILTEEDFFNISFNHAWTIDKEKSQEIGLRLLEFTNEIESENYIMTFGELPKEVTIPLRAVIGDLKDKDYDVEGVGREFTWLKIELIDLAQFFMNSGGFKVR